MMKGLALIARYRAKALTARPTFNNSNSHGLFSPSVQVVFQQYNKTTTRVAWLYWCNFTLLREPNFSVAASEPRRLRACNARCAPPENPLHIFLISPAVIF